MMMTLFKKSIAQNTTQFPFARKLFLTKSNYVQVPQSSISLASMPIDLRWKIKGKVAYSSTFPVNLKWEGISTSSSSLFCVIQKCTYQQKERQELRKILQTLTIDTIRKWQKKWVTLKSFTPRVDDVLVCALNVYPKFYEEMLASFKSKSGHRPWW